MLFIRPLRDGIRMYIYTVGESPSRYLEVSYSAFFDIPQVASMHFLLRACVCVCVCDAVINLTAQEIDSLRMENYLLSVGRGLQALPSDKMLPRKTKPLPTN